jgi:steroid delta-isomerase-like uncharacterized protein
MMPQDPAAVAEDMAAAWNARDLAAFLSFLTEDVEWDDPAMTEPAKGRDAVKRFSEAVLQAFPDFRYEIRHPICVAPDGSRCAVPWTITGTHLGRLDPPGFAPTGRQAVFEGVDLLDFRGAQVCRITTLFNVVVPAEQLLGWQLRPQPGTLRERALVWTQRLRAAWLRAVK